MSLRQVVLAGLMASGVATAAEAQDYCREYTSTVFVGGAPQESVGNACRNADGTWALQGDQGRVIDAGVTSFNYSSGGYAYGGGGYVAPPVYAAPPPVYYAAPPVYASPPIYAAPVYQAPVYQAPYVYPSFSFGYSDYGHGRGGYRNWDRGRGRGNDGRGNYRGGGRHW